MDRTYRGLTAGIIGAIFMNIINLILYNYQVVTVRFLDWGGILMFGTRPDNFLEITYGLMVHIFWTGVLGVIFSFLLPEITSRGAFLKGGIYAFLVTFIFRVVTLIYDVPFLSQIPVITNLINTMTAFFWGLLVIELLYLFDHKT